MTKTAAPAAVPQGGWPAVWRSVAGWTTLNALGAGWAWGGGMQAAGGMVLACLWLAGVVWLAGEPRRQRRQAERLAQVRAALARAETRLQEVQQVAQLGIWEKDHLSGDLKWSGEIYRICEVDPERFSVSSEAFLSLVHPEDRGRVREAFAASVDSRAPYDTVHRLELAGGRVKIVHERAQPYYDAAGKPVRSVGTVQDVTQAQQAQEALRQSEEKFRLLFRGARDPILILNDSNQIIDCNPAAVQILGAAEGGEILGLTPPELSPESQPDGEDSRLKGERMFREALKNGSVRFEWTHRRMDGRDFIVAVSLSAIAIDQGRILLVHWRDVTERIRAARERERLIDELKRAAAQVQSLSGLLPICSGCKKIRDDKGVWTPLEGYIQERSRAQFSHGFCPQCVKKYFPDAPG